MSGAMMIPQGMDTSPVELLVRAQVWDSMSSWTMADCCMCGGEIQERCVLCKRKACAECGCEHCDSTPPSMDGGDERAGDGAADM